MRTPALLISAMIFAPGALGQVAILDGDFDSLPVGTAPDVNVPAGAWSFQDTSADTIETDPLQMSIVPTSSFQPGATGNSLRLFADNMPATVNTHVSNSFLSPYMEGDPLPLVVSFDLWVPSGGGGGSMYVGRGSVNTTDRAAQLTWLEDGTLTYNAGAGNIPILNAYLRDGWQSIRLEIDLVSDTFDVYYAPRGDDLMQIGDDLGFRSGPQDVITRFTFVNFGGTTPNATSYLDNVVVIPAPGAAVLALGGAIVALRRRR